MMRIMETGIAGFKRELEEESRIIKDQLLKEQGGQTESTPVYPLIEYQENIRKKTGEKSLEITSVPANTSSHGTFTVNVYGVAKKRNEPPEKIAHEFAKIIDNVAPTRGTTAILGYVNIEYPENEFYQQTLRAVQTLGTRYGKSSINAKKIALIEYSSPNIAKPIGIGHLRSTIIGEALARIYEATDYSVIRENYLGDWGTQFGKVIYAYRAWAKEHGGALTVQTLKDLYVRFHEEAEDNGEIENAAREIFAKLETGDPEIVGLWKKFRDVSIKNFEETYRRFGIEFDLVTGESYFANDAQKMIELAIEKNAAHKDETTEAVIADDLPGIPSFLLRKGDGSTLYMARELAALDFRVKEFHPQEILDVVGHEQELHFRQAYALAKKIGIVPETTTTKHVGFGMVLTEGKKMSTRKGTLIELDDLISQSVEKSRAIMKEKNPDLSGKELNEISEIVGLGAVVYNDLKQSRMHNISFDWKRMLDFEGGSAAYLQYTYVRIRSIKRKLEESGIETPETKNFTYENPNEFVLAKKIAFFPKIILDAQKNDAPHIITTYLEELAQIFNAFYGEISIIKTEDANLRASRIALIESVAIVIKNGLALLNIKVPEKM